MSKFSVIIPLFNKEKDIQKTLDSLLNQTFKDFEVIVVNDGSTDKSAEIVAKNLDERIRLFNKENEGVAKTRNFAVAQSQAEYIAFLDADDYWYPFHLENLWKLITDFPENQWFATAYEKKHHDRLTTSMISPIMLQKKWRGEVVDYFENSLVDALAWTSAVCMRRDFFNSLNGFDTDSTAVAGEDTDLWIRAALESPLVFTTKISARRNLDASNRISISAVKNRTFMNPDKYEILADQNLSLKKYLDVNRFSFAIQHKLAKDSEAFKKYVEKINSENLTAKQRFLLKQPRWALILSMKIKKLLELFGFRVTPYK